MSKIKILLLIVFVLQNCYYLINCQKIKLDYLVGEINHNIQIVNGEAILTIPVPKLKGLNGLEPSLDLVYKSNQYLQNKELGLGWSLNGLSEISRCFKMKAQDNTFNNIKFDQSDRFCLDGQRLVAVNGNYGENQTEYKTEIDNFSKILSFNMARNSTQPSFFKVFTKTNLILTYGNTPDSTLGPVGFVNSVGYIGLNVTNKWFLNKIEDYVGNSINYYYSKEINYCYLSSISYANRFINFTYSNRTDKQIKYYDSKIDISINKILTSISLLVNNTSGSLTEMQRLTFEYQSYGPANLSIIKKVNQCYPDLTCLQPLVFQYDGEYAVNESFTNIVYQHNICGAYVNAVCELKQMADMNGDGKMDVVAFGFDGVYVSLNMGNYFDNAKIWSSEFTQSTGWNSTKNYRYILDMNNDGLPDIVGFGDNGVFVALNQNSWMKSMEKWNDQFGFNQGSGSWSSYRILADINNDGLNDIIGFNASGTWTAYGGYGADGKKFGNSFLLYGAFSSSYGWGTSNLIILGDFDSDGIIDINGLATGLWTSRCWQNGIANNCPFDPYGLNGVQSGLKYNFLNFIDLNGDNLPDEFGIDEYGNIKVGVSMVKLVYDNNLIKSNYTFQLNNWYSTNKKTTDRILTLSDVNSDGFLDLLHFDCDGVYVFLNNGLRFNDPKLWNSEIKLCNQIKNNPKLSMDIDGDGLVDIVEFTDVNVKIAFNANKKPRLIKITDSLNNIKEIIYNKLSNLLYDFRIINNDNYRTTALNPDVVQSYSNTNGIGSKSTIIYQYGSYICSRTQGRNACSFSSIKYKNVDSKVYFIDEFFYEYPLTGFIKSKKSFLNNVLLSEKYYNYNVVTVSSNQFIGAMSINKLSLLNNTNNNYESNGAFLKSETNVYSYDDLGNIFQQIENITDNKLNYSKITSFQYQNLITNIKNWYLNQLLSKKETFIIQYEDGRIESKSISQVFQYDSGILLLITVNPCL